jgi:hypothetical protein
MDAETSESLFQSYLDQLQVGYERHVRVCDERNVDFRVEGDPPVLCDVKEIRPGLRATNEIDAYAHLRRDLRNLREKFGPCRPDLPVLLVTVNFSGRLFTGFSVARAMLGDAGAEFSPSGRGEFHHLPRGNAAMTSRHHTTISGVFVFDCNPIGDHALFGNPYAARPVPAQCFPLVRRIPVSRSAAEEDLNALANITFWQCDEQVP